MRRTANGRHNYALADYTVERTGKNWYFGRTSRFGDMHAMKGPYSSERSVALMIAPLITEAKFILWNGPILRRRLHSIHAFDSGAHRKSRGEWCESRDRRRRDARISPQGYFAGYRSFEMKEKLFQREMRRLSHDPVLCLNAAGEFTAHERKDANAYRSS